jgi:NTE family protein
MHFGSRTDAMALALQGGGAHGAFTWGVLDVLLESGRFEPRAASGASAGAMNAIVLAHGLARGGREGAREALAAFWHAVGTRLPFDAAITGSDEQPALTPLVRAWMQWTRLVAPAQLNPLGVNPLREVLGDLVDFERLRRECPIRLFVATTRAATGALRLFEAHELTLDVALASACLPTLHASVEIDGEPYWDGGYSANPALLPLVRTGIRDLMIVTLGPRHFAGHPTRAEDIRERTVEFGFHAAYLRERQLLDEARAAAAHNPWPWPFSGRLDARLRRLRVHEIDGREALAHLDGETRLIAHRPFLEALRDLGREAALRWQAAA